MQRNLKKLFTTAKVTTGVFAVAAVALASINASAVTNIDTTNTSFSLTVSPVLTLDVSVASANVDASGKGVLLQVSPNMISKGTFTATVTSNHAYTISLSAHCTELHENLGLTNSSNCTSMIRDDLTSSSLINSHNSIPSVAAGSDLAVGTSAWGVKLHGDGETGFNPILGTISNDAVYYTSAGPEAAKNTSFDVGISVGSDLLQGTYNGAIVVTAATTGTNAGSN